MVKTAKKKPKPSSLKKKSAEARGKKQPAKKAQWPNQRAVLFRPDRYKYITGQRKGASPACVFCEAFEKGVGLESLVIYEGSAARIVLNRFPYNPGHLMVLPLKHKGDLLALSTQEYEEIMSLVRLSVAKLRQAFDVQDFNIGINLGRGAGAGIPEHLHVHILPRWAGDTNFFPLIAETKVLPMDLEGAFNKIQPLFAEEPK